MARVMWQACTLTIGACLAAHTKTGCHQKVSRTPAKCCFGILYLTCGFCALWCSWFSMSPVIIVVLAPFMCRLSWWGWGDQTGHKCTCVFFCMGQGLCLLIACLVCCGDEVGNKAWVMCQQWPCSDWWDGHKLSISDFLDCMRHSPPLRQLTHVKSECLIVPFNIDLYTCGVLFHSMVYWLYDWQEKVKCHTVVFY